VTDRGNVLLSMNGWRAWWRCRRSHLCNITTCIIVTLPEQAMRPPCVCSQLQSKTD